MGTIRQQSSGATHTLAAQTLVGRADTCSLALANRQISAQHASIFHDGERWYVRDLGSRNGTFVGALRMTPGEKVEWPVGTEVRFGDDFWVLEYGGPPVARLFDPETGERREASNNMLVLPASEDPQVTMFRDSLGIWFLEDAVEKKVVEDGSRLNVDDQNWVLELPAQTSASGISTTIAGDRPPDCLDAVHCLELVVSRDQESVTTTLRFAQSAEVLAPRSFHYLLVLLARARLEDLAEGEEAAEVGWRYVDDVARDLAIDVYRLNVEVYRLRKQLSKLGLRDAATIVERRPQSRQMRIGLDRLSVEG